MSEEEKMDEQATDDEVKQTSDNVVNDDESANDESADEETIDELAALEAEELISRIKTVQAKADENWDVALRTKAEMENVRRRTEKEVSNARKFGVEKMVNEILPVKDSIYRTNKLLDNRFKADN